MCKPMPVDFCAATVRAMLDTSGGFGYELALGV